MQGWEKVCANYAISCFVLPKGQSNCEVLEMSSIIGSLFGVITEVDSICICRVGRVSVDPQHLGHM